MDLLVCDPVVFNEEETLQRRPHRFAQSLFQKKEKKKKKNTCRHFTIEFNTPFSFFSLSLFISNVFSSFQYDCNGTALSAQAGRAVP